jgi:hypothetical protein
MQGILDFLKTPVGQGLLATGMGAAASAGRGRGLIGNLGAGGLMGLQAYSGADEAARQAAQDAKRNELYDMQVQTYKADVERKNAALDAERRKREALPGLFRAPGMTGGEAVPQSMGGIPMFSQPMGVSPMQATPGGLDVMAALQAGYDPKEIQELAGLSNVGMPEVARTVETVDERGRPVTLQFDKFGRPVGKGMEKWQAPVFQNLGNRTVALDPVSMQERGSFQQGVSPNTVYSGNITLRGQNMVDARSRESNAQSRVPAGYRIAADGQGLEFIPGGPADPNAAKKAAPTEFQGKSAIYGTRAQEADRIITSLDGKYSPAAVNTKEAMGRVPLFGGTLEAVGNMALSSSGQKAEQAQRDFINAVLRQESGAVISEQEFDNARKQYFPQPFDSAEVKKQKAQNRRLAIQGILNNARSNASESQETDGPSVDDLLKKYGGK